MLKRRRGSLYQYNTKPPPAVFVYVLRIPCQKGLAAIYTVKYGFYIDLFHPGVFGFIHEVYTSFCNANKRRI